MEDIAELHFKDISQTQTEVIIVVVVVFLFVSDISQRTGNYFHALQLYPDLSMPVCLKQHSCYQSERLAESGPPFSFLSTKMHNTGRWCRSNTEAARGPLAVNRAES